MNWIEKMSKIVERMEKRKKNTSKAKKDLATIMEVLSGIIPDKVTGYNSHKKFFVKASWWNGSNWDYYKSDVCFKITNGKVCITDNFDIVFNYEDIPDVMDYIDFKDMIPALIEFIDNLLDIATWDKEVEIIEKIKNSLSQDLESQDLD